MKFIGKVTPNFNTKEIMLNSIEKDWFIFQANALDLGKNIQQYIQNYINSHRRRRGGTGNLAKAINFKLISTFPARIEWGIGDISVLNQRAKYWFVTNYGKMISGQPFIPNKGNFVPGSFEGNAPNSALRGGVQHFNYKDGSKMGMYPKSPVHPMGYIQVAQHQLNIGILNLITRIKKGI